MEYYCITRTVSLGSLAKHFTITLTAISLLLASLIQRVRTPGLSTHQIWVTIYHKYEKAFLILGHFVPLFMVTDFLVLSYCAYTVLVVS